MNNDATTEQTTAEEYARTAAISAQRTGFNPLRMAPNDARTRDERIITALVRAGELEAANEYRALQEKKQRARAGEYDLIATANGASLEYSEAAGQLRIIRGHDASAIVATAAVRAALQRWLDSSRGQFVPVTIGTAPRPSVLPTAGYLGGKLV